MILREREIERRSTTTITHHTHMRWCYYVYIVLLPLDRTLASCIYVSMLRQPPHALTGDDTNMGWWWWWCEMDRHPCTHAHAHARTHAQGRRMSSRYVATGQPTASPRPGELAATCVVCSIGVVGRGHRPSASIDRCPAGSHTTRAHMTRLDELDRTSH
jgi:hypothetical protein